MTPIDALISRTGFKCTVCGAAHGTCGCWVKCGCGWSYRKGGTCQNPEHVAEAIAADLVASIMARIEGRRIVAATRREIEQAAYDASLEWAREICKPPPPAPAGKTTRPA